MKVTDIEIHTGGIDRPYREISEITSKVQAATAFSKTPTIEDVHFKLQEEASRLGANAVLHVSYQRSMSLTSYKVLRATGLAVFAESEEVKCPFCAETIKREAKKCKHCGSDLGQGISSESLRVPSLLGENTGENAENPVGAFTENSGKNSGKKGLGQIIRSLGIAALVYAAVMSMIVLLTHGRTTASAPQAGAEQMSPLASRPAQRPVSDPSPWDVSTTVNPVDDSKTVVLTQGFKSTGGIVIRCGKKLDAFFDTPDDRFLDLDEGRTQVVRVRYGKGAPLRQTWTVADSFDALFAPSPVEFIQSFVNDGTFIIEFRVDGNTDTAIYEAADLRELLQRNRACSTHLPMLAASNSKRPEK